MSEQSQQRGQQWLTQFLTLAELPASVSVEQRDAASGSDCWLTIDSSDLHPMQVDTLIGDRGKVLDALQYLANASLNVGIAAEEQGAVTIELNGYRDRRLQELKKIAEEAIDRVRETGEEYEIRSLSSAERRQIHAMLHDATDLETMSRGQEPHRTLVVRPAQG